MKPNKAAIFFIGLAYWTIFLGFLAWTVTHYHAIFHAREIPGPLRDFNSWQIGIVIEGGYALFQFFFMRVKGKSKYFFLVVLLGLIYFFQFQYYEATEPVMWKRLIFAAVFPFILSMFAWMGNKMKELKESMAHGAGTRHVNPILSRYSKEELEILEGAGVKLDRHTPAPEAKPAVPVPTSDIDDTDTDTDDSTDSVTISTSHKVTRTRTQRVNKQRISYIQLENEGVKCPFCGKEANSLQAMRPVHNLQKCRENHMNRNGGNYDRSIIIEANQG